jgi:hypothetical protein
MFCFILKELGQLKGQEVHIILEDDNPIVKQPYMVNLRWEEQRFKLEY